MSRNDIDPKNLQFITEINRIIHEPSRLLVLAYLSAVESADFLFIMNETGLTKGNLSSHLSKLETAGYVEIKKEFVEKIPRTLLRITKTGKKAFREYQKNMQNVLDSFPA